MSIAILILNGDVDSFPRSDEVLECMFRVVVKRFVVQSGAVQPLLGAVCVISFSRLSEV